MGRLRIDFRIFMGTKIGLPNEKSNNSMVSD